MPQEKSPNWDEILAYVSGYDGEHAHLAFSEIASTLADHIEDIKKSSIPESVLISLKKYGGIEANYTANNKFVMSMGTFRASLDLLSQIPNNRDFMHLRDVVSSVMTTSAESLLSLDWESGVKEIIDNLNKKELPANKLDYDFLISIEKRLYNSLSIASAAKLLKGTYDNHGGDYEFGYSRHHRSPAGELERWNADEIIGQRNRDFGTLTDFLDRVSKEIKEQPAGDQEKRTELQGYAAEAAKGFLRSLTLYRVRNDKNLPSDEVLYPEGHRKALAERLKPFGMEIREEKGDFAVHMASDPAFSEPKGRVATPPVKP